MEEIIKSEHRAIVFKMNRKQAMNATRAARLLWFFKKPLISFAGALPVLESINEVEPFNAG